MCGIHSNSKKNKMKSNSENYRKSSDSRNEKQRRGAEKPVRRRIKIERNETEEKPLFRQRPDEEENKTGISRTPNPYSERPQNNRKTFRPQSSSNQRNKEGGEKPRNDRSRPYASPKSTSYKKDENPSSRTRERGNFKKTERFSDSNEKRSFNKPKDFSKERPSRSTDLTFRNDRRAYGEQNKKPYHRNEFDERRNPRKVVSKKETDSENMSENSELIRLNRYIANTGICSRREADELIAAGAVQINGKIVTELGYKVKPSDKVNYGGQTLNREKKVYILLNKPKDFISTTDDPNKRKTVMELLKGACKERVYPVGRLDRNTTGLLLFTNDGEMAKKLTHPSHGAEKLYHVYLDKPLKPSDRDAIETGLELEDGFIKVDEIVYAGDTGDKRELGIRLHSGKNRIVRRIFEQLGYEVVKLDRVIFAGLTKKDLPRGRWRHLTERELSMLAVKV